VSEKTSAPAAPCRDHVVEVIDPGTGYRVTAAVETADDQQHVLRFDGGVPFPLDAVVHWDDGELGWQTRTRLERLEETLARWQIAPRDEWEPAPARRSLRTAVGNAPILVRINESSSLRKDLRIHAVCLDVSDSGCRTTWPGQPPLVGDAVEVAWDVGDWYDASDSQWIPARVARITALPFGARHVGLRFELTNSAQAARIRAWVHRWIQEHRRRALDQNNPERYDNVSDSAE
jgi:PilZ domain